MEAAELEVNPHSVANRTHAAAPVVGLSGALVNCLNNLESRMVRTTMRFRTKAKDLAHMLESSDSIDAAASQRSEFGFGGDHYRSLLFLKGPATYLLEGGAIDLFLFAGPPGNRTLGFWRGPLPIVFVFGCGHYRSFLFLEGAWRGPPSIPFSVLGGGRYRSLLFLEAAAMDRF